MNSPLAAFENHARQFPSHEAIRFRQRSLTYGELRERSQALAEYLIQSGSQRVAMAVPRSPEAVIAILGILKAGAAYVPLHLQAPTAWQNDILRHCQVDHVLGMLPEGSDLPHLPYADFPRFPQGTHEMRRAHPDQLMYILYTSGSSGKSKGVRVKHGNVARMLPMVSSQRAFDPGESWSQAHSLSFGYSVWEIWGALAQGGCLTLVPDEVHCDPRAYFHFIAETKIAVWSLTPTVFRVLTHHLQHHEPPSLPDLRCVVLSGEAILGRQMQPWWQSLGTRIDVLSLYALTETAGPLFFHRLSPHDPPDQALLGQPLPDVQCVQTEPELVISGPFVAAGYVPEMGQPEQPFRADGAYATGDCVQQTESGIWAFLGRRDRQIKRLGYRIDLSMIEKELAAHPDLLDIDVRFKPHGEGLIIANVIPRQPLDSQQLQTWLAERLPAYALPDRINCVAQWSVSERGKWSEELDPTLHRLWQELLPSQNFTPNTHFMESGGSSLTLLRLCERIREIWNREVSLAELLAHPTLSAMSDYLALSHSPVKPPFEAQDCEKQQTEMRQLLLRAQRAIESGSLPYCAAVFKGKDLIAFATNQVLQEQDSTAHAEMLALRKATQKLGQAELSGCTLYSTVEPCTMCLSAAFWSQVETVVYALPMEDERHYGLSERLTLPSAVLHRSLKEPFQLQGPCLRQEMQQLCEVWLRRQVRE